MKKGGGSGGGGAGSSGHTEKLKALCGELKKQTRVHIVAEAEGIGIMTASLTTFFPGLTVTVLEDTVLPPAPTTQKNSRTFDRTWQSAHKLNTKWA